MEWSTIANGLGAALSVGSGGLFGLVGSAVGVVAKYFQRKQEQEWEEKKWSHELALLDRQAKERREEHEDEMALISQHGQWSGLVESIKAEAAVSNVHKWANDVRALFRPLFTVMLWLICGWVFQEIMKGALQDYFTKQEVTELVRYMVYTTFFTASAAGMWWFGDRALTPPGVKHK